MLYEVITDLTGKWDFTVTSEGATGEAEVTLIQSIQRAFPDHDVVVSSTTMEGHAIARQRFPELRVVYFPISESPRWIELDADLAIEPTPEVRLRDTRHAGEAVADLAIDELGQVRNNFV